MPVLALDNAIIQCYLAEGLDPPLLFLAAAKNLMYISELL